MKGLKKLALASAVLAASFGAHAMEALPDDALSATTGQAGLTITTDNTNVQAAAIRYYDSDGIGTSTSTTGLIGHVGGTTAFLSGTAYIEPAGPFAGTDPVTIISSFATDLGGKAGSVNIDDFGLSIGKTVTTVDVGTNSAGVSGLVVGMSAAALNVNLIVSFDNGDELNGVLHGFGIGGVASSNGGAVVAATATNGAYRSTNIGGIAITGLTLPASTMIITAGAADFGTNLHGGIPYTLGGTATTSGITITPLQSFNLGLTLNYYDTNLVTYNNLTGSVSSSHLSDGLISLPIAAYGVLAGATEIAAGLTANSGYGGSTTQGLEILTAGMGMAALDIGNESGSTGVAPNTGIMLAGSDAGSIAVIGLKVLPQVITIAGH